MKQVCWSEVVIDSPLHFMIHDYGVQIFAWVGSASEMHSLHVAVPAEGMPPVTTLMSQSGAGDGSAVARRLSTSVNSEAPVQVIRVWCRSNSVNTHAGKLSKRPVAVSWNLTGDPILQVLCLPAYQHHQPELPS